MDRAARRSLLSLPSALKYSLVAIELAGALGCSSPRVGVDAGHADRPAISDGVGSDIRRDGARDAADIPSDGRADVPDVAADVPADGGADLALDAATGSCDGAASDRVPLDQTLSDALPADRARYHQCVPGPDGGVEQCDPSIVQEPEQCPPGCRACKELVSALYCFQIGGSGTRMTCTPSQVCEDEPDPPCCECLH
jgi:hypothetical protein